jgi:hypothetical protein
LRLFAALFAHRNLAVEWTDILADWMATLGDHRMDWRLMPSLAHQKRKVDQPAAPSDNAPRTAVADTLLAPCAGASAGAEKADAVMGEAEPAAASAAAEAEGGGGGEALEADVEVPLLCSARARMSCLCISGSLWVDSP